MHVLIFTGQFGMGHIAAAQAVQEEILRQEPTASVYWEMICAASLGLVFLIRTGYCSFF